MQLTKLKGIGEKTEKDLNKLGIQSVEDLLRYYPRRYECFDDAMLLEDIMPENTANIHSVECIFKKSPTMIRTASGKIIINAVAYDVSGKSLNVKWFNMRFLLKSIIPGVRYVLRGQITFAGNVASVVQPTLYKPEEYETLKRSLQPVYSLKAGISNKVLIKAIKAAYFEAVFPEENVPERILEKYGLCSIETVIKNIHFPKTEEVLREARKRVVFDEFYNFLMQLRVLRENKSYEKNNYIIEYDERTQALMDALPYELTKSQKRVFNEIAYDMKSPNVMNRLIQGDVGSGKTIVAVLALMNAAFSGYQGAMMVPTEVLAKQHYNTITALFAENNIELKVVLLTGSMKAGEKKATQALIKSGEADIIIGTHALIQEKVEYNNLALVITDEQHRFGVKQRDTLNKKGNMPHTIVMSATPIPRTLAIILYGDLDISIIDTMPLNRLPIKNCVIGENKRNNGYKFIYDEIKKGHQAYIICPMVDESEEIDAENVVEYSEKIRKVFPAHVNIEYLHGKMTPDKKEEIMQEFSLGKTDILVSTTVIEVGINVPNATVMMIENAERFGLAQLHQLRGRVGRGDAQSYCIFVNCNENDTTKKRLDVLAHSNDGFYIANEDLKTRGPGDFFGVRQSGEMLFDLADIYSDADVLSMANEAVNMLTKAELEKYSSKSSFYLT